MTTSNCVICNKATANACAVCKSASYCSRACQAVDWPLHRMLCRKFSKLPPRPKTLSRLGFLLSADDPDPQLVWVPCSKSSGDYESPVVESLLENPLPGGTETFTVCKNELRGYLLDHTVIIYRRANWLSDNSKPNQAVLAMTEWDLPFDWRGNILIMSRAGLFDETPKAPKVAVGSTGLPLNSTGSEKLPHEDFQDVSMADLRIGADYMLRYGAHVQRKEENPTLNLARGEEVNDLSKNFEEELDIGRTSLEEGPVKGVFIMCEGDIGLHSKKFGKAERYSEVSIDRDNALWKDSPTEASKMMGLPFIVHRVPANPEWNANDHTRFDNQPATFLNLTVDPKNDELWGFAPPEWQFQVGSVIVVRRDGKDLSWEQGYALAQYMQFVVSEAFEEAMESGEEKQRRTAALKMLNWKRFDAWLEDFKVEMTAADGKSWKDVKSPF